MKAIGEGFGALLREAPVGKLLLMLGSLLVAAFALLLIGDRAVGYTHYWKLDRKLDLIERVDAVEGLSEKAQEKVDALYMELADELRGPVGVRGASGDTLSGFSFLKLYYPSGGELIWKALSALVIPAFFYVWWIAGALMRKPQNSSYMGAFIFGALSVGAALCIPTIYSPWVNIALNPICQLLVLAHMVRSGEREPEERQKKR